MELTIGNIKIEDIRFGTSTRIDKRVLYVNREELTKLLLEDPRFAAIELELAKPGESTRIMPVKDVVEPRIKVAGAGQVFPGFIGGVDQVGQGKTHVLQGACVVVTGKIVGFQEGIIDMSGPGAAYSPFSQTVNLVIVAEPTEGLKQHQHELALRLAGLTAAHYLGKAAKELKPDELIDYQTPCLSQSFAEYNELPKVAYVYMLQSQGLLHDTYYYGLDVKQLAPTLMLPTEAMDGAIVSGNCVSACDKNTTYHHQNNPVIQDLLAKHGKELYFVGCVITNENVTLQDKQRSSGMVAKLVEFLGADGVIISEEGFGNPDTDLIMNCTKIEGKGIKTVLITDEYAGRDGHSQSLADASPVADAVVTAGNANAVITLPSMERVIGHLGAAKQVAGGFSGSLAADGSITIELQAIIGATNELGFNKMTAKQC